MVKREVNPEVANRWADDNICKSEVDTIIKVKLGKPIDYNYDSRTYTFTFKSVSDYNKFLLKYG